MLKFLRTTTLGAILACASLNAKTYDIEFDDTDKIGERNEVYVKSKVKRLSYGPYTGIENSVDEFELTFIHSDLRKKTSDSPKCEIVITQAEVSFGGESYKVEKYLNKKIIGQYISLKEQSFTCDSVPVDEQLAGLLLDQGVLNKMVGNYLNLYKRKKVAVGDSWPANKQVYLRTYRAYGKKLGLDDIIVKASLMGVKKISGYDFLLLSAKGVIKDIIYEDDDIHLNTNVEHKDSSAEVSLDKMAPYYKYKIHSKYTNSIYSKKEDMNLSNTVEIIGEMKIKPLLKPKEKK